MVDRTIASDAALATLPLVPARSPARPADVLDDPRLFARLLGGGRAGARSRRAAERLLAARSLLEWARLPHAQCVQRAFAILGDPGAASRAGALFELARRATGPPAGVELTRAEDVVACLGEWRCARREHFVGFYLNARNHLLTRVLVSIGSLSASIVHPREVFLPAIVHGAAGLIVAHNHPSGDPEPSPEDVSVTRRLAEAGELLGIELLDHVVVAERGFVSFKARGRI
jgi:DNA repair protein RadC